jgi:hypothetical protein
MKTNYLSIMWFDGSKIKFRFSITPWAWVAIICLLTWGLILYLLW